MAPINSNKHLTSKIMTDEIFSLVSQQLPQSSGVNIGILSQLFNSTTTSYKYLFFLSLLDILERHAFEFSLEINLREVIVEMLINAWYPHSYFKLSFGSQDRIAKKLDQLAPSFLNSALNLSNFERNSIRKLIQAQNLDDISKDILRYVPFRLIYPFFQEFLRGVKDTQINQAIVDLSREKFQNIKPLYSFKSNQATFCQSIILHQDWIIYFRENFSIVRGWTIWQWLMYMQKRNPSTPNIVSKIFPPIRRSSLDQISKLWEPVIQSENLSCIYSGQSLQDTTSAIDHFLPWSFVAHDLPWNLIPVDSRANLMKSNHLPSVSYLDLFIGFQHKFLVFHSQHMTSRKWDEHISSYISDLRISAPDLLILEHLQMSYRRTLEPLLSLANQQGFIGEWTYKP